MAPSKLSSALVAEFVGTFALVFVGAGAGALAIGGLVGVALAHGLVLAAFVYAYGHLSGTHVNPAVTFGVWMAGRMDWKRALSYWVFQILGGAVAGFALLGVLGGPVGQLGATTLGRGIPVGSAVVTVSPGAGFAVEGILTFLFVTVILHAAVAGRAGNSAGIAIGVALAAAILVGGPLTGASLNPARTLGPAFATSSFPDLWVYIAGPLAGALVAALLFRRVTER